MIKKENKNANRVIRHIRVRKHLAGTAERPRLNVYRSLNEIYAQVIDDTKGTTIASASTREKALAADLKGKNKTEQANLIGSVVAKRAMEHNVTTVVFDRGGYIYTGRVAALAEGARSQGLKF